MWRLRFAWLGLVICSVASVAAAQDPGWRARSFALFELEPEVVPGLWAETFGGHSRDSYTGGDFDSDFVGLLLAQGWRDFEIGVSASWVRGEASGAPAESGISDVAFYGKAVPIRTEYFNLGGGLEVTAPTGDEGRGLGTGELGLIPFVGASVQRDNFQLRGSVAYVTWAAHHDSVYGSVPSDGVGFGGGLFFEAHRYFGASIEVVGSHSDAPGESTPLQLAPAINFRFLLPECDLVLRPVGFVGLTSEATDWGIIGSIILTRSPDWVSRPR